VDANEKAAQPIVDDPDGSVGQLGGRAGRETRLDLLLAEELAVNQPFVQWFVSKATRKPAGWPAGDPESCRVVLNVWEPEPEEHQGETDLHVLLRWKGGDEHPMLIEDKVFAAFQPAQGERYRGRADAQGGIAILVAPASYPSPSTTDTFDGRVDIEDIAAFLRTSSNDHPADSTAHHRLQWRAAMLQQLMTRRRAPTPAHPPTVAFTKYCVDWLLEHGSEALPNPASCRTVNQGWLYFTQPPELMYKAQGWGHPKQGAVDLYLKYIDYFGDRAQAERDLRDLPSLEGFDLDVDTQDNVVLRFPCAVVAPAQGPPASPEQQEKVIKALEACGRAATWAARHGAALRRRSPPRAPS
jgi:hypothetical protein